MRTIVSKPLDWFKFDPTQPRKSFDMEELRQLRASLVKKQLVPVIARPDGTLVDGERRVRASRINGQPAQLDTIIVEGTLSEAQVKEIQLVTALHRADLKPFELYCGCKSWLELRPGATAKELAAAIDFTEAHLSKVLSLDKCIPAVKEAAAAGKIGLSDWYAISRGEAEQAALLAAKLNGATRDELVSRGRKARNGGNPAVRLSRVKCAMPSGVNVSFAGAGDGLSLDDIIETLTELLKEARKANDQGLDSRTFQAVMRDKAKAGA